MTNGGSTMSTTLSAIRTHNDSDIPVAGVYTIDPAHTSVEFIGRHLMITKVRGRFPEVSGTITIDEQPERSHVEVELNVASLDTGNPDRDGHLRSPYFFDADTYPTITFRSTNVERIAFSAATDIDREDWGLTWNMALDTGGMLVGKKVRIELNVQAVASAQP